MMVTYISLQFPCLFIKAFIILLCHSLPSLIAIRISDTPLNLYVIGADYPGFLKTILSLVNLDVKVALSCCINVARLFSIPGLDFKSSFEEIDEIEIGRQGHMLELYQRYPTSHMHFFTPLKLQHNPLLTMWIFGTHLSSVCPYHGPTNQVGHAIFSSIPKNQHYRILLTILDDTHLVKMESLSWLEDYLKLNPRIKSTVFLELRKGRNMLIPVLSSIIVHDKQNQELMIKTYVEMAENDADRVQRCLIAELAIVQAYYNDRLGSITFPLPLEYLDQVEVSLGTQFKSLKTITTAIRAGAMANQSFFERSIMPLYRQLKDVLYQEISFWMMMLYMIIQLYPPFSSWNCIVFHDLPKDKIVPLVFFELIWRNSELRHALVHPNRANFPDYLLPYNFKTIEGKRREFLANFRFYMISRLYQREIIGLKTSYKDVLAYQRYVLNMTIKDDDDGEIRLQHEVYLEKAQTLLNKGNFKGEQLTRIIAAWPYAILLQKKLPMEILFAKTTYDSWSAWTKEIDLSRSKAIERQLYDLKISSTFYINELRALIDNQYK